MNDATILAYCQRDVEMTAQVAAALDKIPLPSFAWLCANLDRWYVDHGRIVLLK